jgi:hypothetical protein
MSGDNKYHSKQDMCKLIVAETRSHSRTLSTAENETARRTALTYLNELTYVNIKIAYNPKLCQWPKTISWNPKPTGTEPTVVMWSERTCHSAVATPPWRLDVAVAVEMVVPLGQLRWHWCLR